MAVNVEIVGASSEALLVGLRLLLPQLSSSKRFLTDNELRAMVDSPCTTLFVAKEEDRIVGMICLVVVQMPTGLRSYLGDLVVDSSRREQGIGEALLTAAIERAKHAGVRTIDATTRPARATAMNLYARVGLERRDTIPLRYAAATDR